MRKMHFITRLVLACFVASLMAGAGVLIVAGDWRPLVSESIFVSFVYSLCIGLVSSLELPFVVRRMGKPGLKLTVALSAWLLLAAAAGCLTAGAFLLAIGWGRPENFWNNYAFMVRMAAALAVVCGLGAHFYEMLTSELRDTRARLKEKELEEERAKKLALEAKLSSLESRVHPHFLFNTLNSISSLIPVNPQRAEDVVGTLAALLRSSLNSTEHRLIPLELEMEMVRDYLSIEKSRLGDRMQYSLALPEETANFLVPPFSVQSLVENAVKYGIAPAENGGHIEIAAQKDAAGLRVEVRDSGPGFDLSSVHPGHGLDNLISRLDTLFGPKARLEVARREGRCVVSLVIPGRPLEVAVR